jgi:NADPH2:quinone reductase
MMRAIQFNKYGGPEVLKMTEMERPVPKGMKFD